MDKFSGGIWFNAPTVPQFGNARKYKCKWESP